MIRILLVTNQAPITTQIIRALKTNGNTIFYLDDRENMIMPPFLKGSEFLWRVTRRIQPLRVKSNKLFAKKLIKTAKRIKPDLIFFNKATIVKKNTLSTLNSLGFKTANWFIDNINHDLYRRWFLEYYNAYDYLFIFDSGAKKLVRNEPESDKVIYLPLAVDPNEFRLSNLSEIDKNKYSCDVCFVGARYPEREETLMAIKNMGVNLKIYGWKGWEKTPLAQYYHGPLNIEETVKLYNCAKICLNMNLEPACDGVNLKTFEIPAAGGFQLSDYRKDVENLFEIGKEIDIFHNKDELKKKILFYIKNPDLAKNIAKKGQKRTLAEHTLDSRMAEMLRIVGDRKQK